MSIALQKHGEDWQNVLIAAFEDTKKLKEERRRLQTALNSAVAMRDKHKSTGEELKACAHRLENDREVCLPFVGGHVHLIRQLTLTNFTLLCRDSRLR